MKQCSPLILLMFIQLPGSGLLGQVISFPSHAMIKGVDGKEVQADQNEVQVKKLNDSLYYVLATINANNSIAITSIDICINYRSPEATDQLKKNFHWIPNINAAPGQICAQHVFRSPCIIHVLNKQSWVLIPDLELRAGHAVAPYYLRLVYTPKTVAFHYGLADYQVVPHQYYSKTDQPFNLENKVQLGFFLLCMNTTAPLWVLKSTNEFFWTRVANKYTRSVLPQTLPFEQYAGIGYGMALQHLWVDAGEDKGGITLSTYYDEQTKSYRGRDSKNDLWFQSWFNNMRTAYGLYYWGTKEQQEDWKRRSLQTVNLLLSAPARKGWFATICNTQKGNWMASSQQAGTVYHMPDNAWTAYWLLRFNDELKKIKGAAPFLLNFAKALLKAQNADGSFPTMIDTVTMSNSPVLDHSASSSIATWYLEELLLRKKITSASYKYYQQAIKRSLQFLTDSILPQQRFEDFESYFSCSPKPMHYFDTTTNMFSQNTLSLQLCAQAYLKAYELFGDKDYLQQGEYCLNILSLYQQVWNPPFISLYAFGGFGAQNTDAEWNDARQAQFADTYLQYYQVTKNKEYLERGIAACRASFALMVLPENKEVCPKNYQGTPVNGESWPGTMAENYGHSGKDSRSYQSGFHWGTGSALTTAAIFKNTLGDLYIDFDRKIAEGVDGLAVQSVKWETIPKIVTERLSNKEKILIHSNGKVKKKVWIDGEIVSMTPQKY